MRTLSAYEMGGGPDLDNIFRPAGSQARKLWDGPCPAYASDAGHLHLFNLSLQLANGQTLETTDVASVRITAEASMGSKGGRQSRTFDLGLGVNASLAIGSFRTARVINSTAIPPKCLLYVTWSESLQGESSADSRLVLYEDYATPGTRVAVPEGAYELIAEDPCIITWDLRRLGATISTGVAAGTPIPIQWGSFSCNVATQFTYFLRPF